MAQVYYRKVCNISMSSNIPLLFLLIKFKMQEYTNEKK